MSTDQRRHTATNRLTREDSNQRLQLLTIQVVLEGQVVSNGSLPAVSLQLSDPAHQTEDQTSLPVPQQEQQSASASVFAALQPSYERQQATAMQESCADLCQEEQVFQQPAMDDQDFVNNGRMLRMYCGMWFRSSNGDILNIRNEIQFRTDPVEMITVIDAVCTHVPITLRKARREDVIEWLRIGLARCENIEHSVAKILIVRLKRRIACIYFRQQMLSEARQEIDEVKGIITGMLKDCVDVGIADAYWLLAWIKLYEVWDNQHALADALQDILYNGRMALEIAQKLPDEALQKACSGRIACLVACLMLHLASCFKHERAELVKEAKELVNEISQCVLAKSDWSLWCRVNLWLNRICGESSKSAHLLNHVINECRGVDTSNSVFTMLSAHHCYIESRLCDGIDISGNGY